MVRHEAVRKKRNAEFFDGDGKERFERVVITCRFEKQAFSRPAVDNVEEVPSGSPSPVSGHAADGATGVPHLVAPAGVVACAVLISQLPPETWVRLGAWMLIGLAVYFGYAYWHSRYHEKRLARPAE